MLGAGALGRPRVSVWGRRKEEGSGWETQVYCGGFISIFGKTNNNIVKFKNKIKLKKNKKQRHYFANKGPSSQGYDFSSGHVWM